jgi:histidinol-phosphatase (PHP family)
VTGPDGPGLPADDHVHSEWSWDAPYGSMERACRRAAELGLPSVAFTDHADFTVRSLVKGQDRSAWQAAFVTEGVLSPPPLDVERYLAGVRRCRRRFPGLRIVAGVELGEPHRHAKQVADLLGADRFERVLASVHVLPAPAGGLAGHTTVDAAYDDLQPGDVVRRYLREVLRLVEGFDRFDVLAHVDYAARYWPRSAGELPARDFEADYRAVLAALVARGKVLEVSTQVPLALDILRWWREEGGEAITFGSDAHRPGDVARGFADAAALAATAGFAPGRDPLDLWRRR